VPFTSQTAADLETVKARLAECEQQIAEAEFKLPNASLRLALGNAEPGDDAVGPRLRELHAERDLLRSALSAAEQAEADRKEQARQRALASQCRAASQHQARAEKELLAAAAAGEQMQRAFDRFAEAMRSTAALLPGRMRDQFFMQLSPKYWQKLLLIETYAAAKRLGSAVPIVPEFSGYAEHIKGWRSGTVPTLSQLMARDLTPIKTKLRELMPPQGSSGGCPFLPDETAVEVDAAPTAPSTATSTEPDAEAA
jgi:hypothetical protein